MPEADQRLVDLGELGLRDALVARDAAHHIPPQRARRDREPRQADVAEPLGDAAERGAAGAHHEHALVLPDQAADRVDDRLGAAGSGHRADDERVAGRDLRDDVLLLGVGVEQQDVGGRLAAVRIDRLDRRVALFERPFRRRVAGERVEHGILEVLGVGDERRGDLREGGDHEPRLHLEVEQVAGEGAQLIDHGVRLEGAVALAQRDERLGVERDAELALERGGERRVEERRPAELELEVAAVAADRERAQQQGRAEVLPGVAPAHDADAEPDGVEAAGGRELETLRGDPVGGDPSAAQRDVVADELGEQRRLAGDELGHPAGMRGRELDAGGGGVDEVQQRRDPAEAGQLLPPGRARGVGDVAARPILASDVDGVRPGHLTLRTYQVAALFIGIIVPFIRWPHTATIGPLVRLSGERRGVSRTINLWLKEPFSRSTCCRAPCS